MTNTKNLASLAAVLDDGTSGQVLQSTGSGGVQFADSTGSGVTVHANQAAMLTDAASASEGTLHYETGTNKLYVKQSSGFYLLASITNASPTIDSFSENTGGAGANNLTAGGTFTLTAGSNTVVTINATEPDLETISYSATVTSGTATDVFSSPSFPVTNQSSNVFTLTPVTSGTGGTVTIRFDASDGTNVANVSHSFEIAFIIADSHFTSLLMATDGSAGDNNDITDSSTNNHTITVNGDAHAGTFSPYRHGGYSVEFVDEGSNGYGLQLPNTTFNNPSTTFTIEAWVYLKSYTSNATGHYNRTIMAKGATYFHFGITADNKIHLDHYDGTARYPYSNDTVPLNEWTHVCAKVDNGSITFYINGTASGTGTWYGLHSGHLNTDFYVGMSADTNNTANNDKWWDGYLSNVRFVDGTAITPSSGGNEALDPTTANTEFLLCASNRFIDSKSTSPLTVTPYRTPKIVPIGPYDYQEYSDSTNGGSVYFDGTDDRLSITHSTELQLGTTSAFTAEFWVYIPATNADYSVLLGKGVNSGTAEWHLELMADEKIDLFISNNGTSYTAYTVTDVLNHNTWYHIALVRENTSTIKVYTNGVQSYSNTSFSDWNIGTGIAHVGGYGEGSTTTFSSNTYLTDVRIVKGTAVYTGNFTPPSGPLTTTGGTYPSTTNVDTSITASNTKLLLKGTDAHVIDKSQVSNLKLEGNAAAVTNAPNNSNISSTNAVSFDGNGDRIYLDENNSLYNLSYGQGDFSIEGWFYFNSYSNNPKLYIDIANSSTYWQLYYVNGTGLTFRANNTGINVNAGSALSLSTWYHIALVREGSTYKVYVDGTSVISTTTTHQIGSNSYKDIGGTATSASLSLDGYIQDFRLTKGLARHVNTNGTYTYPVPSTPLKG